MKMMQIQTPLYAAADLPVGMRMRGRDGMADYVVSQDGKWVLVESRQIIAHHINQREVLKEMLPFKAAFIRAADDEDDYVIACERPAETALVIEIDETDYKRRGRGRPRKEKQFTREPSAYNRFVGEIIKQLVEEKPHLTGRQRMTLAASMWKKHKEQSI